MFVLNSQCPYLLNQLGMVHIIKEAFNIKLYYIMQFCELHQIVGSLNSVLHGAIWSEAVAAITEFGFANWFHTVEHWPCIRTSSVIERPNRDTRCRIHVVRTFPNGNSALTLPRAMPHHVADIHSSNSKHINIKPLVTSTLHIRILHLLGERCPYQYARNDK